MIPNFVMTLVTNLVGSALFGNLSRDKCCMKKQGNGKNTVALHQICKKRIAAILAILQQKYGFKCMNRIQLQPHTSTENILV